MSEVISLSTFHNHNLTDQDHALFMQTVTSQSGLFYGCEVTLKDENTLHVSTGEGIACGRIFRIMDMDYPVELSASGDLLGRLYVHIDTALDDTPAQLMDVQGSTLPALIQEDDMNQSTGVYEIELATFSINELGISNLEFTAPKATGGGAGGKSIAPDYSATESYEKGRIFFQNGTLYKTIAAIPAGAPLVVDTNVVETSLAAEIEALNQNLTCRWNPSTKYYQVYANGQWYNDRYFDPIWDGYIFNNGVYSSEYYIDTWNNYIDTSGGASPTAHKYPSVVGDKITSSLTLNSVYYCRLYSYNTKAFHVDRPCTITFNIEVSNNVGSGNIDAQPMKIKLKDNANANDTGVLMTSNNLYSSSTQVVFNLTASQYVNRDVYFGFTYIAGLPSSATTNYLNIKSIHVDYVE